MPKWHIDSATGRGRLLPYQTYRQCLVAFTRNGFHTSSPKLQDGAQDRPAAIDARNLGAPLAGQPLSKPISRNEDDRSIREATGGAVDARSLGSRPAGAVRSGGFTMRYNASRDGRSPGAVASGENRIGRFTMGKTAPKAAGQSDVMARGPPASGGFTISKVYSDIPTNNGARRPETMGLQERRRFPPRLPGRELVQSGEQPSRRPRTTNGIQERAPRLGADRPLRPAREGEGVNRRTPRAKGSNARRGGGTGRDGRSDRGPPVDVWSAEEKEYFEEKTEREAAKLRDFDPKLSEADLNTVRPAVMSGPRGMGALLGDRLLLARRFLNNEFMIWESKEQKADVIMLAEKLKAEMHRKSTQEGDERSPTLSETQAQTDALMQKLWGGKYELVRPTQERDIIGHVARQTDRNESYYPEDEKTLLQKIRTLLPAEQARNVEKGLKSAVR